MMAQPTYYKKHPLSRKRVNAVKAAQLESGISLHHFQINFKVAVESQVGTCSNHTKGTTQSRKELEHHSSPSCFITSSMRLKSITTRREA